MTKVLLGLGFVLVVALAMVAGAGVHTWLDDATETADFQHTDDPLLTTAQVKFLVYTFLWEQVLASETNPEGVVNICYRTDDDMMPGLVGGRIPDFEFEYVGDKLWLASNLECIIRVSDATGKVSSP